MNSEAKKVVFDPLIDNNPVALQILGICPALAVTTSLATALTMAIALTVVLAFSNTIISMIRHHMPSNIRIIVQMTVIASLVIVVDQFLKAYAFNLSKQMSVFIGLIITNCIVLGRAEAFSSKNKPLKSIVNALGMGIGFTFALLCLGVVREVLGAGAIFGFDLFGENFQPWVVMILPPGGFLVLGGWLLLFDWIKQRQAEREEGQTNVA